MKSQFPLYIVIAGIGVLIGLFFHNSPEEHTTTVPTATADSATPGPSSETGLSANPDSSIASTDIAFRLNTIVNRLNKLQDNLKLESASRQDLQKQLVSLRNDVKLLASSKDTSSSESQNNALSSDTAGGNAQNSQWFNSHALVAAGVDQSEAEHIQQVYEDVEMQKLYLRDKAIREGWIGDDRYQKERAKLDSKLDNVRDELGEKGYDAYLYATGQPNRVTIVSALENSPASKAGIQAGDTVLRYDNKRIYSWGDLRRATTEGQPDTMVTVDLIRDGSPLTVYVPRGPLGVQLDNQSVAPQ